MNILFLKIAVIFCFFSNQIEQGEVKENYFAKKGLYHAFVTRDGNRIFVNIFYLEKRPSWHLADTLISVEGINTWKGLKSILKKENGKFILDCRDDSHTIKVQLIRFNFNHSEVNTRINQVYFYSEISKVKSKCANIDGVIFWRMAEDSKILDNAKDFSPEKFKIEFKKLAEKLMEENKH